MKQFYCILAVSKYRGAVCLLLDFTVKSHCESEVKMSSFFFFKFRNRASKSV